MEGVKVYVEGVILYVEGVVFYVGGNKSSNKYQLEELNIISCLNPYSQIRFRALGSGINII